MNKYKIAVGAALALGLTGLGVSAAVAATIHPAPQRSSFTTSATTPAPDADASEATEAKESPAEEAAEAAQEKNEPKDTAAQEKAEAANDSDSDDIGATSAPVPTTIP